MPVMLGVQITKFKFANIRVSSPNLKLTKVSRYTVDHHSNVYSYLDCPCSIAGKLETAIDYSRYDQRPGSYNFTILAVSTTDQVYEFVHQFCVPRKY